MKAHTSNFKNSIKQFGRQLNSKISYILNGETIELGDEELNSITPTFQANILKSAMKELDIDSNVDIPLGTIVNYKFGVLVDGEYEYLDYGDYIVYSSEKKEDTGSYEIVCYDYMLRSMTNYNELQTGSFPMTVREYLTKLCNDISLEFANENETFMNYDKIIASDLYKGLEYTYRDIFDELSQVTASTICINDNNQVEVRYIKETNDSIDEEYLKDVNVTFGEKYGPINSIVLSRSGGSDNVFIQDEESVRQNGLCELKITDNQIMNWNDRSDYLADLLFKLGGLEYYINDFTSTGICYYDICDRYNVKVGDNTYSCVMFNDQIEITQGLVETIHTDMPEQGETDYTKSDKTDRKINQTYLIVDKQNQQIEAVISNTDKQNQKIAQISATVDEINSKISDIADITVSGESSYASVTLNNINESEPILLKIRPILENISYLYPHNNLFPSNDLLIKTRTVVFINSENGEIFNYTLPNDLLYYDENTYDEFNLGFDTKTCNIIKRCGYDSNGNVVKLEHEITTDYPYPYIELSEGNYTISLLGYRTGYIYATLMSKNIYTSQFYTKVETNSLIDQTASSIDLNVNQKLSNYSTTNEMNAAISLKANEITSGVSNTYATKNEVTTKENTINQRITDEVNEINLQVSNKANSSDVTASLNLKVSKDDNNQVVSMINASANKITLKSNRLIVDSSQFKLDTNGNATFSGTLSAASGSFSGNITSNSGAIGGWTINSNGFTNGVVKLNSDGSSTIYTVADLIVIRGYIMGTPGFDLPPQMVKHYDLNNDGIVNTQDYILLQRLIGIIMN